MTRTVGRFGIAALVGSLALAGCGSKENSVEPSAAESVEATPGESAMPKMSALGLSDSARDTIFGKITRMTPYNPVSESFAVMVDTSDGIYTISVTDCQNLATPQPNALWLYLQDTDNSQSKNGVVFARAYSAGAITSATRSFFNAVKMGKLNTCFIAPSEEYQ